MAKDTTTGQTPQTTDDTVTLKASDVQKLMDRIAALERNNQGGVDAAQIVALLGESNKALVREFNPKFHETAEVDFNPRTDLNPDGEQHVKRGEGDLMFQDREGRRREVMHHILLKETDLSPDEIRALNLIQSDCSARNGRWTASIRPTGTNGVHAPGGRLVINLSDSDPNNRLQIPSLYQWAMELAKGPKAVDVAELMKQLTAVQAQLKELEAGKAVAAKSGK